MQSSPGLLLSVFLLSSVLFICPAFGQQPAVASAGQTAQLTPDEVEKLVAPIALYPDPLIANILPAATVPMDVVQAARWLRQQKDAVETAPQDKQWDSSVMSLLTRISQMILQL